MNIPRSEYPRPQFIREGWMNLNGEWQFEIDNGRSGEARGLQNEGVSLEGKITVPFCPESELSGVCHKDFMYGVWYKRRVTVDTLAEKTLLHFGAVDYINTERDVYLFAVSNSGRGMSYVQEIPQTLLSVLFEQ